MSSKMPRQTLATGFINWISLMSALVDRDIRTRFAGGAFGHAWAIIIPVSWIAAITVFFHWTGRTAPISSNMPLFLATGMVPYLIFRQSVTAMMRARTANRHLITLGPAKMEDVFTATALLELLNAILFSAVILTLIAVWIGTQTPQDPLVAIYGLGLAWALGISFGRFAATLASISDSAMRLTPIILRPFFWISGIFFIAAELPAWLLSYLWFNPLLHAVEILRSGYFAGFDSYVATSAVPIAATIIFYLSSRLLEAYLTSRPGLGLATP